MYEITKRRKKERERESIGKESIREGKGGERRKRCKGRMLWIG